MVIDPRLLNTGDLGDTVSGHRTCPRCEYDLIGLRFGSRCPECGTPIRKRGDRRYAPQGLTDAPIEYLRRLHLACLLLAVLSVVVPGFRIVVSVTANTGLAMVSLIVAIGWLGAVWLVTLPRPFSPGMSRNPKRELLAVRLIALFTQGCWALAALAEVLALMRPAAFVPLGYAGALLELIALFGFVPLAIWLGHIAECASDSSLATKLHASTVTIAVANAYILVAFTIGRFLGGLASVVMLLGVLALFAYAIALVLFICALIQLAVMTKWAIRHAEAAIERDEQLAEIAEVRAAAASRKFERVEDEIGIEFDDPATGTGSAGFHGHRIEPDEELNPYDLAD